MTTSSDDAVRELVKEASQLVALVKGNETRLLELADQRIATWTRGARVMMGALGYAALAFHIDDRRMLGMIVDAFLRDLITAAQESRENPFPLLALEAVLMTMPRPPQDMPLPGRDEAIVILREACGPDSDPDAPPDEPSG
jgi:hypothetical protein